MLWRDALWLGGNGTVIALLTPLSHPTSNLHARPLFQPFPTIEGSAQALCQRCNRFEEAISKIPRHHPFVPGDVADFVRHPDRAPKKTAQIPSLGPTLVLQLLSTCPLCRLIFDVTCLEDEEMEALCSDLVMVTGWIIHRLEPDLHWSGYRKGNGPYAKCLYTSVALDGPQSGVSGPQPNHRLPGNAVEAIGLVDAGENRLDGVPALGVRQVDPDTPDYSLIKDWLYRCDELHHDTCRPFVSEDLKQIKLIDVGTRQIVMYPPDGCDYVALSYVWGDVEQPAYRLEETLPTIPATLEDAMVVTHNLGKRYLWADSLCINQGNSVEKAAQMALMSAIYSGACATIIPLSAQSARCGLPRVGTLQGVISQLSYEIWGIRMLSAMPTLSQQVEWSAWSSRAWTYQEGLLSPRRLFFTNHQVYFECNSTQCCESLDDTSSPFHLPSDEQRRKALKDTIQVRSDVPERVIRRGIFRDPFRPISSDEDAQIDDDDFARYWRLVQEYTMRTMSQDDDSLNAFSAVLTRMTESYYKDGFVQGLPVQDLPRALLWFHPDPPRRRISFPAWSWTGWEDAVDGTEIIGIKDPDDTALMPPLRAWKAGSDDHPKLIYDFNPTTDIEKELENPPSEEEYVTDDEEDTDSSESAEGSDSDSGVRVEVISNVDPHEEINFGNDPVFWLAKKMLQETLAALPGTDGNELLIEGIIIRLTFMETPDREPSSDSESESVESERCFVPLKGQPEPQRIRFYGHDAAQLAHQRSGSQQEFLLVSREQSKGGSGRPIYKIYNVLLLVDLDGDVGHRVAVAVLRLDDVDLLNCLETEKRLFKPR